MQAMKILTIAMVLLGLTGPGSAQPQLGDKSVTFDSFTVSTEDGAVFKSPDWAVWTLSGVGIASLGVGIALYTVGQADEASLEAAERDNEGRIRSVTQRRAYRLEGEAADRMDQGAGFMMAGAILGSAAMLWYFYGQEAEVLPAGPSQNQVVPFGNVPQFEFDIGQNRWQLTSRVSF